MFKQAEPRIRVSKTTSLTLSTTFQRIDFSSSEALNVNTFGIDPVSGNQMVYWDSTNKIFKFYEQFDVNYSLYLFLQTTATLLTTRATLQIRCVVPNGTSPGVDSYFPFKGKGDMTDVGEITILTAQNNQIQPIPVYSDTLIRTNGFGVDIRISNSLITLGVATLTYGAALIQ